MDIKTKPSEVWEEYQKGRSFNDAIDLYTDVEVNENMYVGKQWEGLNAPDLPKPVINIIHLVVSWAISQIVSDNVAVSISSLRKNDDIALLSSGVKEEIDRVFELTNARQKNRVVARNGGVHGDAAKYYWFDPDADGAQDSKGEIVSEIIEGRNVHFGNPYSRELQTQPHIIIAQRKLVDEVRDEARNNGMKDDMVSMIVADGNENRQEESSEYELCTVLIKMWKQNGTVWCEKVTETATVRKKFNTGLKLYPIAWFVWEEVADQYHGRSLVTGIVANQIAINRLFAMYIRSTELNAFPKTVYDSRKIKEWNNAIGQAIAATPTGAEGLGSSRLVENISGGNVSEQVMDVIDRAIEFIYKSVGATSAAMGDINPDNASAIIAASQQARVPMEMPKLNHNDFVEQEVRIMLDMMRNYYGKREVTADSFDIGGGELLKDQAGNVVKTVMLDFEQLDNPNIRLNVEIGRAAYWDEIFSTQSLDNLFKQGLVDPVLYVESIPDKNIPNKQKIIQWLKQKQEMASQMPADPTQMGNAQPNPAAFINKASA